jgi:hypothetical protein
VQPHSTRLLAFAALPLAFASVLACHNSTGPASRAGPLSGHWLGGSEHYGPMDFVLTQTDTLITGSGVFKPPASPQAMAVIGFYSQAPAANVVLTFSAENAVPAVIVGHVSAQLDSITGNLMIAFSTLQEPAIFVRQR